MSSEHFSEHETEEADIRNFILLGFKDIFQEVTGLDPDLLELDQNIVYDLDVDSLTMVEMAVEAEDQYDLIIRIPDEVLAEMQMVIDFVNYIYDQVTRLTIDDQTRLLHKFESLQASKYQSQLGTTVGFRPQLHQQ